MGMETIYAALLLHEVKQPANEENLKKVLQATGAQVNDAIIKATVASLENVNIEDAIANASVAAAPAASAAPAVNEGKKKEEKKEETSSDEAAAGLSALFG